MRRIEVESERQLGEYGRRSGPGQHNQLQIATLGATERAATPREITSHPERIDCTPLIATIVTTIMADVFSRAKRSEIMRGIKPWGNRSTELVLAAAFRKARLVGWRRHAALPGRPDFIFRRQRVAVFVDGDFWHANPRNFKMPLSNRAFWEEKVRYNRAKDRRVTRALRDQGWTVIRIWESALKRKPQACLARIARIVGRGDL